MNNFIEQNRRLLRIYCLLAKIFGTVLAVVGCLAVMGHSVALVSRVGSWDYFRDYFINVPWGVISFLPTGYLVLGLAQFLRYSLDSEYQPGWILRNAVKFAYLYAIVLVIWIITVHVVTDYRVEQKWYNFVYHILSYIFYGGAKVILLVGLAQILKRVMPIIEEHKSLV